MKKIYLIAAVFGFSSPLTAQIANGNFEKWSAVPYFENPDNWSTSNGAYKTTVGTVTRWGIPQDGQFAANLESKEIDGKLIPGVVTTGKLDTSNLKITGGQPVSGRPVKLTGYYHYNPAAASGDLASFEVLLSKWNTVSNKRDTIAYGQYLGDVFNVGTDFKAFEIPLNYTLTASPDSQLIIISSSKNRADAKAGSALWVDNLNFEELITGIEASSGQASFIAYPNPAENQVKFITGDTTASILIYDILGKKIDQLNVNNSETVLNTDTYGKGIYYYTVVSSANVILHKNKFIIK